MELSSLFLQVAISLALGMLVGLQRERSESGLAGVRTFPLITALGSVCGLMAPAIGGWVVAAGLLGLALLIVSANLMRSRRHTTGPGMTTEVAMLLMYAVGAYLVLGTREVAIAVGVLVAVLLNEKQRLHGLVERLGDKDIRAIMQFALLALAILPALPDRTFGPYDVFNPHETWLMVVLIVGINIGAYVAYKIFGGHAGTLLAGVLGGLISSTATTVSYARQTARNASLGGVAAVVIIIASSIVFARLLVMVALVAPGALAEIGPPIGVMLLAMVVLSAVSWFLTKGEAEEIPEHDNPGELKPALFFGALYAAVVFAAAAAKTHFGERGLYAVALISGLTDVDAITLSSANMVNGGLLTPLEAWRIILIAALSNLVFKGAAAAALGGWPLFKRIAVLFALALAFGIVIIIGGPMVF